MPWVHWTISDHQVKSMKHFFSKCPQISNIESHIHGGEKPYLLIALWLNSIIFHPLSVIHSQLSSSDLSWFNWKLYVLFWRTLFFSFWSTYSDQKCQFLRYRWAKEVEKSQHILSSLAAATVPSPPNHFSAFYSRSSSPDWVVEMWWQTLSSTPRLWKLLEHLPLQFQQTPRVLA
jgi:hypothetical protein